MRTYNFKQYEKDVISQFRKDYPSWDNLKDSELEVCEDGTIQNGFMQFKTDIKFSDYKL